MMPGMNPGGIQANATSADANDKLTDLSSKIEKAECYARNDSSQFPMENLFIGDTRLGCKSDTDEQLILHIEFQEFVKVRPVLYRIMARDGSMCMY